MPPIGAPDEGTEVIEAQYSPITDLGEVVRRLMGWSPWDGRGSVLWADGFENGLNHWAQEPVAGGGGYALATTRPRRGWYHARITSSTTASAGAALINFLPFPHQSLYGMEIAFLADTDFGFLHIFIIQFDGTNRINFRLRYDDVNNRLEYLDSAGAWQVIASGLDRTPNDWGYNVMKLVVDPAQAQYVRALFNERSFSLSGIAAAVIADTISPVLYCSIWLYGRGGTNDIVFIDDVIITNNE